MRELLAAVSELVSIVSYDRVAALAAKVRTAQVTKAGDLKAGAMSAKAYNALQGLVGAWKASTISGEALAVMLLAAAHAFRHAESRQRVELVWTGPSSFLLGEPNRL